MMDKKEQEQYLTTIKKYSLEAQAPYKTLSMKEILLSGTYNGPPKYLK